LDISDIDGSKSKSRIKPYKKGSNFEKLVDPSTFVSRQKPKYNLLAPHNDAENPNLRASFFKPDS
jgi:hypothetical protein